MEVTSGEDAVNVGGKYCRRQLSDPLASARLDDALVRGPMRYQGLPGMPRLLLHNNGLTRHLDQARFGADSHLYPGAPVENFDFLKVTLPLHVPRRSLSSRPTSVFPVPAKELKLSLTSHQKARRDSHFKIPI